MLLRASHPRITAAESMCAGCAVLSMDMYNDATRLVDGNFDGALDPGI